MAVGPLGASPAVILSTDDDSCLPIYIGLWEAISIYNALHHQLSPRPLTHDLFVEFMNKFGISLKNLIIDALEDGIYYASLILERDLMEMSMDCRPSDGIAISIRCDAEIFVDPLVLQNSAVPSAELKGLEDLNSYLSG